MSLKSNVNLLFLFALLFAALGTAQAAGPPLPSPPSLPVKSYVLENMHSGQIIASQNADQRIAPASMTKLMTIYIVFAELKQGKIHLGDKVTISTHAWHTGGSRMFLEPNTQVSVQDLLRGTIVDSGNDASVALAEYVAGTEKTFADYMNQVATRLGMNKTHFVNATGLPDPQHYSTAHDLATLTRALIRNFPDEYKMFAEKEFTYNNIHQVNRNGLLWRDPSVDGLKTGHTDSAGYCLVTSAKRDNQRLISVVTGAHSDGERLSASESLLNYGFRFFETHLVYQTGKPVETLPVWKGARDQVPVGVRQTVYVTLPRSRAKSLQSRATVPNRLLAPVQRGQRLGAIKLILDGKVVRQVPLYALKDVPLGGLWTRTVDGIHLYLQQYF